MQVFSPTALASGTWGFAATRALTKPGAGRGRELRSTVPSAEKLVDGSELLESFRAGWECATAQARTKVARPSVAVITTLQRPWFIHDPSCSYRNVKHD